MAIFAPLFRALNDAGVRYVVVGGVAVVLHGYARLTVDVDLVIDLDEKPARQAMNTLVDLGLQPRIPVNPVAFADQSIREAWIRDRGMQVFSMVDPSNPMRVVDLFVHPPLPFEEMWARAENFELQDTTVSVASIPDLIQMKRIAARPQDLADIEGLEGILRARQQRGDE
ncbi:MAG: nucleotidyl transferase AbiEii/AbiGii toxin family protein [Acidobacteriota bacterium]